MKVSGSGGAGPTGRAGGARPASGGPAFTPISPAAAQGPTRVAAGAGVTGVSSLQALMTLQEAGTPMERRKRAAARGTRLLDALDHIKIGLLEGALPRAAVESLAREAKEQRGMTDDPRLDAVLAEIETRAAVELAKLEITQAAA
jgi:hypothetical protein